MWPHGHDQRWDRMQMQHLNPSGSHNLNTNANRSGCLCNDWTNIPSTSQYQHFAQPPPPQQQQQQQQQQEQKMGHHQHQPQDTQYAASTCTVTRMNPQWYTRPAATPNFFISDTPASNSREMRNRAEKLRRDKLNSYILQLATLVPMVSSSAKRMDKTSILRLTATHLRIYHTLLNGHKPKEEFDQVDSNALENLIYEQLEGFLLILTPAGRIVFVSHTVEQFLGHLQTDLMGQSIYTITAAEDHEKLRVHLSLDIIDVEWRRYFNLNLAKAGPRTEAPTYEQFNVMGMIRPSNNDNDNVAQTSTNKNNLLVFFVKLYRPPALSDMLIEANKEEYITRHLIDGRIMNCDHRISFVAGYMIEEVSGLSAFKFMHREDVRWTMIGLRQMYDRGESVGWSCYRLRSRTGRFIYLRTLGYLEVDKSGLVESFVCVNTLVTEEEGKKLIHEMKERFSVMINYSVQDQFENEMKNAGVEDSHLIDECVKLLITQIQKSPKTEPSTSPKPSALISNESQDCFTLTELTTTTTTNSNNAVRDATSTTTTMAAVTPTTKILRPPPILPQQQQSIKRLKNETNDDFIGSMMDNDECIVGSSRRKRQKRRTVSSSSSASASSTDIMICNDYQAVVGASAGVAGTAATPTSTSTSTSPLLSSPPPPDTIVLHQTAASICRPNLNDRRHNDQSSVY